MRKAWPRFLPKPTAQAIAHALIIEASVIAAEALGEGQDHVFQAHKRAEAYARTQYSEDDIQNALGECAALPGNEDILLHHVMRFLPAAVEVRSYSNPALQVVVTTPNNNNQPPRRFLNHRPIQRRPAAARLALAAQM